MGLYNYIMSTVDSTHPPGDHIAFRIDVYIRTKQGLSGNVYTDLNCDKTHKARKSQLEGRNL